MSTTSEPSGGSNMRSKALKTKTKMEKITSDLQGSTFRSISVIPFSFPFSGVDDDESSICSVGHVRKP